MSSGQANAAIAEDKAHTLNATHETQTIVTPVVIDRAAFNQCQNAQYEPHIEQTDVMDSLVARGPHAVGVPFRKAKRAQSTTDNETWFEADASNTLNNFDLGDTRTTHAVVEPICFEPRSQDGHARVCGNVSPTLNTAQGGQRQPCVAITFQPGNLRREAGADPSTTTTTTTLKASAGDQMPHIAYCAETAGTLTVGHHSCAGHQHRMGDNSFLIAPIQPIAFDAYNQTVSNTSQAVRSAASDVDHVGAVLTPQAPMAVRRLTPTECERLQGFPDNWSQIPWKGKPADQCPDGPRYKCAGNSMAVPVMRWIGEQIARVELSLNNPTK